MPGPWDASTACAWSLLHISLEYETLRWTHHNRPSLASSEPLIFHPGEIVYAPNGRLSDAYFSFLQARGYELTPRELVFQAGAMKRDGRGKYCLVVDRAGPNTYWVCYLATFTSAGDTSKIASPVGRYFGLAFGDVRPWPPDFEGVQTSPRWSRNGYIVAIPVLRDAPLQTLRRWDNSGKRTMVKAGELGRIQNQIMRKVQEFAKVADQLRKEQTKWTSMTRKAGGASKLDWYAMEDVVPHSRQTGSREDDPILEDPGVSPDAESLRLAETEDPSFTEFEKDCEHPPIPADPNLPNQPAFSLPSWDSRLARSPLLPNPAEASMLTHLYHHLPHDILHSYRSLSRRPREFPGHVPLRRRTPAQIAWATYQRSLALMEKVLPRIEAKPEAQASGEQQVEPAVKDKKGKKEARGTPSRDAETSRRRNERAHSRMFSTGARLTSIQCFHTLARSLLRL